jgi:hypothetical protein
MKRIVLVLVVLVVAACDSTSPCHYNSCHPTYCYDKPQPTTGVCENVWIEGPVQRIPVGQ